MKLKNLQQKRVYLFNFSVLLAFTHFCVSGIFLIYSYITVFHHSRQNMQLENQYFFFYKILHVIFNCLSNTTCVIFTQGFSPFILEKVL